MSTYLCGLDIGGTFTDCVIVDDRGRVVSAKAPSTPGDFAEGLMHALEAAAGKVGQPVRELLANTSLVSHGTTVGTNAIVQKRGARVGLVTTRGHNDVIHIMRGSRGLENNYKLACNRENRHISASNPLIGEPRDFVNDDIEFRQLSWPGCGASHRERGGGRERPGAPGHRSAPPRGRWGGMRVLGVRGGVRGGGGGGGGGPDGWRLR